MKYPKLEPVDDSEEDIELAMIRSNEKILSIRITPLKYNRYFCWVNTNLSRYLTFTQLIRPPLKAEIVKLWKEHRECFRRIDYLPI